MPTSMKVLRGTAKAEAAAAEPQLPVEASFDDVPSELVDDALAAKEWRRLAPMVRVCGLVTDGDRALLLACCQQWSAYLAAQAHVRRVGMVIEKAGGVPIVNPHLHLAHRALNACHRMWIELGLTPSARARMAAAKKPEARDPNKWEGLL